MANTQSLHALLDQTGWIHSLARQLVADPHLAADLAQDTCVEALESGPDSGRPLRGWLATVMRNNLAKLRRGDTNRAARERELPGAAHSPETLDLVERAEAHRNVVLGVLALDEPYRSTLLMRFFEQLPYDEIARRTGLSRATVNSRITRGLEQLRQRLETTYGGDRRALAVALLPIAKLPTGVATTLLGAKVMYATIGTAAATLLAVTVSVAVSNGRGTEPAALVATHVEPAPPSGEPVLEMPAFAAPEAPARVELAPEVQRERQKKEKEQENLWTAELNHTLALAPSVKALSVNASSGDVVVEESTSGQVEIAARVSAKLGFVKDEELTRIFEDHVDVHEEDGQLVIEDKHENSRGGWTVDLVVHVPGKLGVSANSGSGDVIVRRASGRVAANTGSGDVRVELPNERLMACATNTGSGDVVVEVLAVEKRLGANSGSGDVIVRLAEAASPGDVSMSSGSGDVRLIVPANIVGSFELETMQGIEVPPSLGIRVNESAGRKNAQGTVGSGGGKYSLSSGSGELRIELGTALPPRKEKR